MKNFSFWPVLGACDQIMMRCDFVMFCIVDSVMGFAIHTTEACGHVGNPSTSIFTE